VRQLSLIEVLIGVVACFQEEAKKRKEEIAKKEEERKKLEQGKAELVALLVR
jgi:hypothetical protein